MMYIPIFLTTTIVLLTALVTLATGLAFAGGIWLWKHLKPEHRFRLSAMYLECLSLLYLAINGTIWIVYPQYLVDYLVEEAPVWIVLFLGTGVVRWFHDEQPPEPLAEANPLPNGEQD